MQTNVHLRYPGRGTSLCSLPGVAANLSEVIHEVRIGTTHERFLVLALL